MKINDNMKEKILTYVIIILISLVFYFLFFHFNSVYNYVRYFFSLISPFIVGFALAFLLNKPMEYIEFTLLGNIKLSPVHKHTIASIGALLFGIGVIVLFLLILVPQLIDSTISLIDSFPSYLNSFEGMLNEFIEKNNIDLEVLDDIIYNFDILKTISGAFTAFLANAPAVFYGFTNGIINIFVSIMAAFYMLLEKKRFIRYVKKINYAIFPKDMANYLNEKTLFSGKVFNDFIIGKAVDSLIIGLICYLGMVILQLPYAVLLSVVVGITNIIPVFGPFIGAIPGIFILLIINPMYALYFALFILALQQFDGNILGPFILGDKLGIPSLFILFSVCIGGALFGVVGMFIGVPAFTIIFIIIKEMVNYQLEKKGIKGL